MGSFSLIFGQIANQIIVRIMVDECVTWGRTASIQRKIIGIIKVQTMTRRQIFIVVGLIVLILGLVVAHCEIGCNRMKKWSLKKADHSEAICAANSKSRTIGMNWNANEVVDNLNAIWNRNPDDFKNRPHGYSECMVFMHCFDPADTTRGREEASTANDEKWTGVCRPDSSFPWCPSYKYSVAALGFRYCPIRNMPVDGMSFSAFNKHISHDGDMLYGNSGFIFAYDQNDDNKEISPMCFYPTDAATIARSNCGCGHVGMQTTKIPNDKNGYDLAGNNTSWLSLFTTKSLEKHGDKLWWFYAILQPPLNFKRFVDVSMKWAKIDNKTRKHNEVMIKSWLGTDFESVPFVAFFCLQNDPKNLDVISRHALLYKKKTGKDIPLVYFDPHCVNDKPFSVASSSLYDASE